MAKLVKVVAAVITAHGAQLYTAEGQVHNLTAAGRTDDELKKLVAQIVAQGPTLQKPVLVDLETETVYSKIEEKSGGLLRFFRVAKKAVASLLGHRVQRGNVNPSGFVERASEKSAPQPGVEDVTPQIVRDLEAAHDAQSALPDEETTVVALVDKTPIVGAEALHGHAKAAVATGTEPGFIRFCERLALVAKERKHTQQELLAFMQKNDLPIARDGTVIGFKSLTRRDGHYVDNHSHSWQQDVGTLVQMAVEMVDDNRRVLCSNGFHIARRAYLRGYGNGSYNDIFLVKIAPEDVISVPYGEQDKMRVASYHIVAKLSDNEKRLLAAGRSITEDNSEIALLVGKVVAGDHVGVTHKTYKLKDMAEIVQMEPVPQQGQIEASSAVLENQSANVTILRQSPHVVEAAELTPPFPEEPEVVPVHTVDQYEGNESPVPKTPIDVKGINEELVAKKKAFSDRMRAAREAKKAQKSAAPVAKQVVEVSSGTPSSSTVKRGKTKVSLKDTSRIEGSKPVTPVSAADKKTQAIKLWNNGNGLSKAEIRKQLGVAESTLRGWLKNV